MSKLTLILTTCIGLAYAPAYAEEESIFADPFATNGFKHPFGVAPQSDDLESRFTLKRFSTETPYKRSYRSRFLEPRKRSAGFNELYNQMIREIMDPKEKK